MVKQIQTCDLIEQIMIRGDGYFDWLRKKAGLTGALPSYLASVEFLSVHGIDDKTLKSAKENLRQEYSEEIGKDDGEIWLIRKSVRGSCCLLEVIVHLAQAIKEMVSTSSEDETCKFVSLMLTNAGYIGMTPPMDDGSDLARDAWWSVCTSHIINRHYQNGEYGLFGSPSEDKSLWQQMNDYVDAHTDEDGEWVD